MEKPSYINALKWAFLILKKHQQDQDIARYLLLERTGWNLTQLTLHQTEIISTSLWQQFQQDIALAIQGYPPQYILGYAWFYGRKFYVNRATLIPRQDSETMIAQILQDVPAAKRVLELGTGSGALIISLGKEGHYQQLTATDISESALQVAQKNSTKQQVPLELLHGDLFEPVRGRQFDLIVFNPPYIANSELKLMDQSVIEFEPHQALFAAQSGLEFYQRIFAQISAFLAPHGKIYLEFGFQQQAKISKMFQEQLPHWQIEFFRDLANHPRFLRLQRKEVK
ncbi:peptide chain release factor N(5)-glutamine methyltransferase [Bombilactobacillus bombi]|uniref:peptide chain release factor N(5)-glutamine methyltransferase n=1 Tax=Bombilactobacillus bombi TaxID=1303590 RepID=UPI0015E5F74A|nr:peptide chain release factor N(5)-glutamine methyltransferase [Bombilactobacillus bombi]MBA1434885.1 peptide chain release factor N(5)-glutamine methyltransferase [Bombilactobacillus bombi]